MIRMRSSIRCWPVLAFVIVVACNGYDAPVNPGVDPELRLDTVVIGLSHPLFVAAPPNDQARLFIVERTGTIRIFKNGALLPTPFLDITSEVSSGSEQGILGMAFAPNYATSGRFFLNYVDPQVQSVISRFTVSANADVADPASEDTLLTIDQPGGDHNGGTVAFGPDGYLYTSIGDGGCCGDPNGHGQDRTELLGSVLRVDVSGATGYTIPATNPWHADATFRHELWSYGLRNPWRFSFDRTTGDLYLADVGDNTREEVNVVSHLSNGGENFGWRITEGSQCFNGNPCSTTGITMPVLDYGHDQGCAVMGGYVYRGNAIPSLRGTYFYADYCSGFVRSFRYVGGAVTDQKDYAFFSGEQPNSFGEDAAGELYITTEGGNVYRIVEK
jgi:glucose/arabinose dehydrogenase